MAGTTQYFGISYPTATDYVKDGASNMQTIATGFDTAVAIPTYNNQTGTTYTFVLADAAKTVTSNNASAVTFTIPPQSSVAWATGTTLKISNLGAGAVTFAGGSGVTVTNTATTVPQYGEASLVRTGSDAWTVVATVATSSGLTLVNATTITTQSTVTVSNVFTSTYRNYLIQFNQTAASTSGNITFQLTASGTASASTYYYAYLGLTNGGSAANTAGGPFTNIFWSDYATANPTSNALTFQVLDPQITSNTKFLLQANFDNGTNIVSRVGSGAHYTASSYDGFKLTASAGTISGVLKVYGYQV